MNGVGFSNSFCDSAISDNLIWTVWRCYQNRNEWPNRPLREKERRSTIVIRNNEPMTTTTNICQKIRSLSLSPSPPPRLRCNCVILVQSDAQCINVQQLRTGKTVKLLTSSDCYRLILGASLNTSCECKHNELCTTMRTEKKRRVCIFIYTIHKLNGNKNKNLNRCRSGTLHTTMTTTTMATSTTSTSSTTALAERQFNVHGVICSDNCFILVASCEWATKRKKRDTKHVKTRSLCVQKTPEKIKVIYNTKIIWHLALTELRITIFALPQCLCSLAFLQSSSMASACVAFPISNSFCHDIFRFDSMRGSILCTTQRILPKVKWSEKWAAKCHE